MSVRVNLLPPEQARREAAARQRGFLLLSGLLLLVLLGAGWWWAASQVSDAEDRLEAARAETQAIQLQVDALADIRDLANRRDQALDRLTLTLANEASLAGLLQDVALVVPSDSQLESMDLTVAPGGAEGEVPIGTQPGSIGTLSLTAKTLSAHAPGVERFLLELDKVIAFRDLFVNSSALDDPSGDGDVATFSIDASIGPEAYTGRYYGGLPEELR